MPEERGAVSLGQKLQEPQPEQQPEQEESQDEIIRRQLPQKLQPRWDELVELRDANAELIQELSQQGVGIDTMSVLMTKFSALVDTIWDGSTFKGQSKVIDMEYRFEEMMSTILSGAAKNLTQALLAQGANIPPALWNQMAEQQAGFSGRGG